VAPRAHPDDGENWRAWADLEAGTAPLRGLEERALGKAGRKALRRAQHRLRSRGVELTRRRSSPASRASQADDAIDVALVSPPTQWRAARGGGRVEPSGGTRIFQGAVDLERGVLEFRVLQANRSQTRRLLRDLDANTALAATEVPRESVAALLARAAEAQPADRALPQAFGEWRSRVARAPEGASTPGELARAGVDAAPTPSLLREVADAVTAGVYGPWPPEFAVLHAVAEKVRDTAKSRLVDDQQRRAGGRGDRRRARDALTPPPPSARRAFRGVRLHRVEAAGRGSAASRGARSASSRRATIRRAHCSSARRPLDAATRAPPRRW
jgi:hypothetical protein